MASFQDSLSPWLLLHELCCTASAGQSATVTYGICTKEAKDQSNRGAADFAANRYCSPNTLSMPDLTNSLECCPSKTIGSLQFSPLTNWVIRGTRRMIQQRSILCQSFLHEAIVSSSSMGRKVHSLMLSIQPMFLLLTMVLSPTLQGALKDGFGEAVTVCVTRPNHASFHWEVSSLPQLCKHCTPIITHCWLLVCLQDPCTAAS